MVIAYWIVAGLLALFFLYAGGIKVVQTREKLRPMMASATGFVLVQVGGIILHVSRGEAKVIGLNIALVVAAGVTAWLASVWV